MSILLLTHKYFLWVLPSPNILNQISKSQSYVLFFFFFFTFCLEITTSSLRSAWKSSIIKPSCLFSIQEPSFCLVWFGLVIWNLIVYLLPIWHHLVWCMTFGSPISCYSLQVWISHALPKPLRALKYPDHAWWEETRVLKTHVDVFICLNDFTSEWIGK